MSLFTRPAGYFLLAIIWLVLPSSPLAGHADAHSLYMPVLEATALEEAQVMLLNPTLEAATVTLTARSYSGAVLMGTGIINPVSLTLPASSSRSLRAKEIFGEGIATGWVELQASSPSITGSFLLSDSKLSAIDGAALATE